MRLEGLNILYVCAYSFRYQPKLILFFFSLSMSAHYDNHHFIYSIFVSLFFPRLLFITLIAFIGDEKLWHQLIFQTLKIYFTNNLLTQNATTIV